MEYGNYSDGRTFLFRGERYPLRRVAEARFQLVFERGEFVMSNDADGFSAFESWYKRALYDDLRIMLPMWTRKVGVSPRVMNIKTVKTLWGSCSSSKSLTFCTRLALAPPSLTEYVVVHELCHIIYMNHSPLFWAEVAKHMSDYKERRALLRKNAQNYKWW